MPCAHLRSRRSWLRAYALAFICRPSASSAAPQALQGSISFSCVTGGSHLRLRLDEPPPATFCRPPDSKIPLAYGSQGKRSLSVGLCSALKARAAAYAELCYLCAVRRGTHKFVCRNSSLVLLQITFGTTHQLSIFNIQLSTFTESWFRGRFGYLRGGRDRGE